MSTAVPGGDKARRTRGSGGERVRNPGIRARSARLDYCSGVKSEAPKNASMLQCNPKRFSSLIQKVRRLINADYRINFRAKNRKHIMLNIE
jgi:hypothetical protein